ncbi:PST family polysaccharide transporter [Chitinophaga niastensis]|uniref:PST family polysaccharide transporter n=1 Tax=Chitinophaga niastensis TaxID=536980 RepID=A0A2P8HM84_CHINA|nr:flippase [Chitinophaga niastensis]PSL47322.1 PST family polysaccharide transporter [Chitinophaga niastensis]
MHKIFENSGWLLVDKLSKLFPGIIIMALIARHLGPAAFGVWSYAIALTTIIGSFALLGMDKIAVKELLNNEGKQPSIVATLIFMRIAAGIISMIISVSIIVFTKKQQPAYLYCTIFSALNIILQSFDVFDYFYQADNNVKKVIIPKVAVFIAFCIIKLVFVLLNGALIVFLWLSLIELLVTYLIILAGYRHHYMSTFISNLDFTLGKALLIQGWPLLFSNLVVVLFVKIDLLLLDVLGSAAQVGEYVVAARISELWYAIPVVISTAVLPGLIHKKNANKDAYLGSVEKCLRLSFWISLSISITVMLMANIIIPFLYGSKYASASLILMIHIWASIPVFLCSVFVQYLIIEGRYKISLYGNIIGLIINVGLNLLLIRPYGGVGAAIATVIAYTAVYGALVLFDKSRQGWILTRRMLNPLLAFTDMRQAHNSFKLFMGNFLSVSPKKSLTE